MSYNFSIDRIEIINTRSRHEDTVYVSISVAVAGKDPYTLAKRLGHHNNGSFDPGMALSGVPVADDEVAVFTYIILNNGHSGERKVLKAISEAATTVARGGANAAAKAATNAAAAAVGAWVGSLLGSGVPIIGTIVGAGLGALAGSLLNELIDVINPNCDGPLASAVITIPGRALREKLDENQPFGQHDTNPGIDSPPGCGSNSHYRTSWSVRQSRRD